MYNHFRFFDNKMVQTLCFLLTMLAHVLMTVNFISVKQFHCSCSLSDMYILVADTDSLLSTSHKFLKQSATLMEICYIF